MIRTTHAHRVGIACDSSRKRAPRAQRTRGGAVCALVLSRRARHAWPARRPGVAGKACTVCLIEAARPRARTCGALVALPCSWQVFVQTSIAWHARARRPRRRARAARSCRRGGVCAIGGRRVYSARGAVGASAARQDRGSRGIHRVLRGICSAGRRPHRPLPC